LSEKEQAHHDTGVYGAAPAVMKEMITIGQSKKYGTILR